jgi:hypothetical protein
MRLPSSILAAALLAVTLTTSPVLAGSKNTYTESPDWVVKVDGDLVKGKPAIVVLNFRASNGYHVKSVFGYNKKASFYLKTCAKELPEKVPRLIADAKFSREASRSPTDRPPFNYNGLKFVSAECVPPPAKFGDLDGPNTAVEYAISSIGFR